MKRFIITIVFFLVPVLLLLVLAEYGLRQIPNEYAYKNAWLEQNISTTEVLVLGNSYAYYGIDPAYFTGKAFNASHVSQTFKYDAYIIDKYIDRADSLKYVVLTAGYGNMICELESGAEWWRVKKYCIYYQCPYHKNELKFNTELIGINMFSQYVRLKNYLINGDDEIYCDTLGYGGFESSKPREMNGEDRAKKNSADLIKSAKVIEDNKVALRHIADVLKEKNIKLLIVAPPACGDFYNAINEEQYTMSVQYYESVAESASNVVYLNMLRDERFEEIDFTDADHLNREGAKKLTKILDELITQIIYRNLGL